MKAQVGRGGGGAGKMPWAVLKKRNATGDWRAVPNASPGRSSAMSVVEGDDNYSQGDARHGAGDERR